MIYQEVQVKLILLREVEVENVMNLYWIYKSKYLAVLKVKKSTRMIDTNKLRLDIVQFMTMNQEGVIIIEAEIIISQIIEETMYLTITIVIMETK